MYRTRICKNYEHGFCQFGDECLYAHGEDKLRKIPTLDTCWFYNNGTCTNGDNCPYTHEKKHVRKPIKLQKPCWDYHIKKNCTDENCVLDHFELTDNEISYHFPGIEHLSMFRHSDSKHDIWRPTDPKYPNLYFNSHSYSYSSSHSYNFNSSKKRHKADKKTVESLVNLIKDAAEKLKSISKNNPELYEMAISKLL